MTTRLCLLVPAFALLSACLNLDTARETAAQHSCHFADKCGEVGSGQNYATIDECLTKQRADYLDTWSTSSCDGKINADTFNACITAIDNTQCNNLLDTFNTAAKCSSSKVCTASNGTCNCGNGQTCCNGACVTLQTDRNNCGACGTTCGSSTSCQSGVCR